MNTSRDPSPITVLRTILKARLLRERGRRCILTGKRATDLHEVFLTRADYPFPDRQAKLFVQWNCVVIDHTRHVDVGLSIADRITLGRYLVSLYGVEAIEAWAASLNLKTWRGLDAWFARLEAKLNAHVNQSNCAKDLGDSGRPIY